MNLMLSVTFLLMATAGQASADPTQRAVALIGLPSSMAFADSAAADNYLPAIGGGGGSPFSARCAKGELLAGVELRVGEWIDAIRPQCVIVHTTYEIIGGKKYDRYEVTAGTESSWHGGFGGGLWREPIICGERFPFLYGITVGAEGENTITVTEIVLGCNNRVAQIGLWGFSLREQHWDPRYPWQNPDPRYPNPKGANNQRINQRCPDGEVAVGIHGRSGEWLDALGLICGAPPVILPSVMLPPLVVAKLQTTGPEPVKPQARVKLPPGTAPSPHRPICDLARQARARNSPAAPGLEQTCRNDLAGRGLAIARLDSAVAAARTAETDNFYRQGFDIATGIFGDPALGAWGRTETGPGSLGIRDKLTPAGQRGFNASVKFHLGRNYE